MTEAKNYFAWQGQLILPQVGRRVVEVGCGIGNFTGLLLDRDSVFALDVEKDCVDTLRRRFPDAPNLTVLRTEPGTDEFQKLKQTRPDTCVCINVLEHIGDDTGAVRSMAELLGPGGNIVLLVPAFPSLFGQIDRNLGHQRRYHRGDLRELAARAGLDVKVIRYWNAVGFFGWWWNARVRRREAQSVSQIRFFDRLVVPVMSRVERLIRLPFGQSLFAVLRKPLSSDT